MRWLMVLLLLLNAGCATQHFVRVGDQRVLIEQIQHGQGKTFVHLHQNETTALHAATSVVHAEGGRIITLKHSGQRNIVFHLNGQRYEFDPNRIFTDAGIKKTLTLFGHYSKAAHQEVKTLATVIKQLLPKEGSIIAVHNNKNYSIKEYLPGHKMHQDAKALSLDKDQYYRNFYLVTQTMDYQRLTHQDFNAILQTSNPTDDGSLSVYLSKRHYINVEAAYGQLQAQIKMLKAA